MSDEAKKQIIEEIEVVIKTNGEFPNQETFVDHHELYTRIDAVMMCAKTRISQCPAELLFPQDANEISGALDNIKDNLDNFFANSNQAHINNIQNNFLPAFARLIQGRIPTISTGTDPEAFAKTIASSLQQIRSDTMDLVSAFHKEQAALDKNFTELTSKKDSIEESLDEFETETKETIEELKTALDDEHKEIIALNGGFSEEFQIAEKERNTAALTAVSEFEKKGSETISTFTDESKLALSDAKSNLRQYLDKDGPSILNEMESMKEQAKKLLHMIGGSTMADGFSKTAEEEKEAADLFRKFAGWLWILAAAATGYVIHSLGGEPTIGKVLGRIAAIFMLAAPATYMTIESRGHRIEARRAKRYALEMLALEPFLATLDEDIRKAKIEGLTERYFGNIDKMPQPKEGKMPTEQLTDFCKAFLGKSKAKDE
ncbi:hypothetical protein BerOc1_00224 [Pseudodesulfovibrio hydrargyri]|uniref:Uncharacterized protein n=1 Tax=Pseudodesulfovibrio hydrargyri TaxID=2125990 RepID=A0A1J5MZ89_9BACT|nr:hypothetical protein [Pseudodesulfovibrio hydrargyri]OIQ51766.1 hypothetical protein BerOc1_00224 [Pseudodesulfovibrio hydrargyri]